MLIRKKIVSLVSVRVVFRSSCKVCWLHASHLVVLTIMLYSNAWNALISYLMVYLVVVLITSTFDRYEFYCRLFSIHSHSRSRSILEDGTWWILSILMNQQIPSFCGQLKYTQLPKSQKFFWWNDHRVFCNTKNYFLSKKDI